MARFPFDARSTICLLGSLFAAKASARSRLRNPHEPHDTHAMSVRIDVQTEDLRLFVGCLAEGSLSAAARTLGLTQAVATRRIQRLEGAVGAPVRHRTTRALRPTAAGERLLTTARAILGELAVLERGSPTPSSGDVRVSASVLLGQVVGSTLARELAQRHPELRLHLSLSNERIDLLRTDVDVALRVGKLSSTTSRATRLATTRVGAYVRRDLHPRVSHPSELLSARWVGLSTEGSLRANGPAGQRWRGKVELAFVCDDRAVLRAAAADGLGVALLPTFFADPDARLRRLVPDWHFGLVPVHALWLPEARDDPRVRAVLDALRAWGRGQAW
jgi:DNA-binding transcriptional LysR family regulator